MYQLSVIVPGIRNNQWLGLYNSIDEAFSGTWEVIFIGPYDLPEELKQKENVQYIKSFRSPIACQQIGLIASRGEYISWAADDGRYIKESLDIAYKSLIDERYTTLVTGKYQEGERLNDTMETDWYYKLSNHESMKLAGVPKDCLMINCGLIHRSLLTELGGWDSVSFQVCPMAYNDFAIRAHRHGCKFILQEEVMFSCTHEPGMMGTHGPIHIAQTEHDEPMFRGIYCHSSCLTREVIRLDNWKQSPEIWGMRFNKEAKC